MDSINRPSSTSKYPKWLLPAGIVVSVFALAGCVAVMVYVISAFMKSSDAYQQALAIAKSSPAVASELGSPLAEGFFASGHIRVSGPSGDADLAIPVSGPKGAGTIFLEAHKSVGEWSFSKLVFEVEGSKQRINLLEPRPGSDGATHAPSSQP